MFLLQVMGWLADSLGKASSLDHNLHTQPWPLRDIAVVVEPLGSCKSTFFPSSVLCSRDSSVATLAIALLYSHSARPKYQRES